MVAVDGNTLPYRCLHAWIDGTDATRRFEAARAIDQLSIKRNFREIKITPGRVRDAGRVCAFEIACAWKICISIGRFLRGGRCNPLSEPTKSDGIIAQPASASRGKAPETGSVDHLFWKSRPRETASDRSARCFSLTGDARERRRENWSSLSGMQEICAREKKREGERRSTIAVEHRIIIAENRDILFRTGLKSPQGSEGISVPLSFREETWNDTELSE